MARIRSIKPEFWTDDDMLELSDSCALFFVALWNFCDDEGKIQNQPRTISKLTGRWSAEKVKLFIKNLEKSGKLRESLCSAWLQVVNWNHQRINRPIQPKVKTTEIQWVTPDHSVSTHDSGSEETSQGKDRIGRDGIGLIERVDSVEKQIDQIAGSYQFTEKFENKSEAFEYLKTDDFLIDDIRKTVSAKGWRAVDEVDVVGFIKLFVSAKAKMDQPPEDMKQHFRNWIFREPVDKLTEYAKTFKKSLPV